MECNFDKQGNCNMIRKMTEASKHDYYSLAIDHRYNKNKSKWFRIFAPGVGCCNLCYQSNGYFDTSLLHEERECFNALKHMFLPVVGFWRIGGCSLTQEQKSSICRNFRC